MCLSTIRIYNVVLKVDIKGIINNFYFFYWTEIFFCVSTVSVFPIINH